MADEQAPEGAAATPPPLPADRGTGPTFNQMVVDLWNSTAPYFRAQGKDVPPRDTGIFNNWRQHLISGDFKGIPLSWEYTIHRPDGHGTTAAQNFAGGTCLWNEGNPTWL